MSFISPHRRYDHSVITQILNIYDRSSVEGSHTNEQKEYDQVIAKLFDEIYKPELSELSFDKDTISRICDNLGLFIRNIPDVIYTYRYRSQLPEAILQKGNWIIEGRGKGKYAFVKLSRDPYIQLPIDLEAVSIPDATPDMVLKHSGNDEQSMLARVRYNRIVDIFLGITTFHLQGHFRTFITEMGQVEVDDLYVGIDGDGREYVIPVGAKGRGRRERAGISHVADLIRFGKQNYPELELRPLILKGWDDGSIFILLFNTADNLEEIQVVSCKRYMLIPVGSPL